MPTEKKPKAEPWIYIPIRREMGTRELVQECRELLGEDRLGRMTPGYGVVHIALEDLRDKLKAKKS